MPSPPTVSDPSLFILFFFSILLSSSYYYYYYYYYYSFPSHSHSLTPSLSLSPIPSPSLSPSLSPHRTSAEFSTTPKETMKSLFGKGKARKDGEESKVKALPPIRELQTSPGTHTLHYFSYYTTTHNILLLTVYYHSQYTTTHTLLLLLLLTLHYYGCGHILCLK
jgi:hypothetical protein